jgi:hypothetical protein
MYWVVVSLGGMGEEVQGNNPPTLFFVFFLNVIVNPTEGFHQLSGIPVSDEFF